MDIRVGNAPKIGAPGDRAPAKGAAVEAKILAIRAPRRRRGGAPEPEGERRGHPVSRDPVNSRVLVLLIPDSSQLPEGFNSDNFRIFLRFARR